MSMAIIGHKRLRRADLDAYAENTRIQKQDAEEQLRDVGKIVGQAELLASRLRDAADTFIYRDRTAEYDDGRSPARSTAAADRGDRDSH